MLDAPAALRRRRKQARIAAEKVGAPQPVRVFDGGYEVLRPTKGWLRVSARRLEAQRRMAAMLTSALPTTSSLKIRRNEDPAWRKPFVRDFGARP